MLKLNAIDAAEEQSDALRPRLGEGPFEGRICR